MVPADASRRRVRWGRSRLGAGDGSPDGAGKITVEKLTGPSLEGNDITGLIRDDPPDVRAMIARQVVSGSGPSDRRGEASGTPRRNVTKTGSWSRAHSMMASACPRAVLAGKADHRTEVPAAQSVVR